MKYQPVIGLEIHIQSNTKSKMFCTCDTAYFGADPNTHVCPTCLGLPGALPTVNKTAIDYCLKLAIALNCKINTFTKFDRKNYFYPDLPKGYQISQFDLPIGYEGYLEIDVEKDSRRIRITRVHQEEDTGKSLHEGEFMYLDFNKSGVPLIEVVTEPDFESVEEVVEFAKELKRIVRYLGVSNANMEKGQMRFELNISLKEAGTAGRPDYKVEVKNIGSISVLEKVINSEIKRQSEVLEEGKVPSQETRGLKDMSGETVSQRFKEGSSDYRYFPEPDIPPIEFDNKWMEEISEQIPELPKNKRERFEKKFGLSKDISKTITENLKRADFFEKACLGADLGEAKAIGNWFVGDFMRFMKKEKMKFSQLKFKSEYFIEIVRPHIEGKISGTIAKQVFEESFRTGISPAKIVSEKGLEQINDGEKLEEIIKTIIKNNPGPTEEFKKGKEAVIKFFVGQVMRETKGKANPKTAEEIFMRLLKI